MLSNGGHVKGDKIKNSYPSRVCVSFVKQLLTHKMSRRPCREGSEDRGGQQVHGQVMKAHDRINGNRCCIYMGGS